MGGGITDANALEWINAGADKVIVTSYLFIDAKFSLDRLRSLSSRVGKDRLVVDVSCRKRGNHWIVAMNKWQTMTDMKVTKGKLCFSLSIAHLQKPSKCLQNIAVNFSFMQQTLKAYVAV